MNETERGARRGDEVRCPACARFKSPRGRCPHCGCGEVPAALYGVARMMARGGVDRFSLAERVATLDAERAELLGRQYAAQWELAQRFIEDVRRCEAYLLQRGFVEDAEDLMASVLPTDPEFLAQQLGPPERPETLEALFKDSTSGDVRRLAALGLMHQGQSSPIILGSVHGALHEEGRVGVEAALALTRWRIYRWTRLSKEGRKRVRELARKAMAQPELAPRGAVAWVRASGEEPPEVDVLFNLRAGLTHEDADVRFECALCLKDEAGLVAALDSPEAGIATEARRVLASLSSPLVFKRLARDGGADFAQDVIATMPWPAPPGALEAVLTASEREPGRFAQPLLRLIEGRAFAEWSADDRARWSEWARVGLRELSGEQALKFLHWAAQPPVTPEAVRPFVEATAEALEREPTDMRAKSLGDAYFSRFLALAGPSEEPRLHQWARDEACGPPLARELMILTSRLRNWEEPPAQAARLLMAVWEGPERERLLQPLRQAVREWSGIVGRDVLVEAVWRRFQHHPDERRDLLFVFAPWRQELWERHVAAEEDAVARFEAWWPIDPEGFHRQASLLMEDAPVDDLPRRVRCVLAAGQDSVMTKPRTASLAVFYAAAALANAFRAGEDSLEPEVRRFLEWFPGFEHRVLISPPEEEEGAPIRHFLDDLYTEVRLMRERLEEARKEEEETRQREVRREAEESRRRDLERQAELAQREAEEAQRAAQEAQRAAMAAYHAAEAQQAAEAEALMASLRPRIESKPIDTELLFPGKRLRTLVDYVRLLKVMSRANPVHVMAAAGLDASTWAAEATAWGQAMTQRLELGMRFGELFAAPWE